MSKEKRDLVLVVKNISESDIDNLIKSASDITKSNINFEYLSDANVFHYIENEIKDLCKNTINKELSNDEVFIISKKVYDKLSNSDELEYYCNILYDYGFDGLDGESLDKLDNIIKETIKENY